MDTSSTPTPNPETPDPAVIELHKMTRRGLVVGGASVLAGLTAATWMVTRKPEDGLIWPLRKVLEFNEGIARASFRPDRLAPTFAPSKARWPRANGLYGLESPLDRDAWRLRVKGSPAAASRSFTLDAIRALPRVDMTTELRCIEGWSTVVRWTGVRLADLAALSGLATKSGAPPDASSRPNDLYRYASLATPDEEYFVGLDMPSALHPQTLLAYEMNGEELTDTHGAPLRLVIPVKYGIKHIKRIGTITFTDQRPRDFWAEEGYDWYAGH